MTEGRMPCVVLHELAYGFHDPHTGFDDARVTVVRSKYCKSGKCKNVPVTSSEMRERYGLTTQKEFFAETWGSLAGRPSSKPTAKP
jgi:hypothetical protein